MGMNPPGITTPRNKAAYRQAEEAAIALQETIEYLPHDFVRNRAMPTMCSVCLDTEWDGNHLDEAPEPTQASDPDMDPDEADAEAAFADEDISPDPMQAYIRDATAKSVD